MPVVGTPIQAPSAADVLSNTRINVKAPAITTLFGEELLLKKRAIRIKQASSSSMLLTFLSDSGSAVDLSSYGLDSGASSSSATLSGGLMQLRFREATLASPLVYEVDVEVQDAAAGIIRATVPSAVAQTPGVYLAEAGLLDEDENLLATNELYLFVEKSAWATAPGNAGPPTIDTLRIAISSSDPFESLLTNELAYDLTDLCAAMVNTVEHWDTVGAPIGRHMTTTFPWQDLWILGVRAYIFRSIAEFYRRNQLPHSVAGVSLDDLNKEASYRQAWLDSFAEFDAKLKSRKYAINVNRVWGGFRSGYPY